MVQDNDKSRKDGNSPPSNVSKIRTSDEVFAQGPSLEKAPRHADPA